MLTSTPMLKTTSVVCRPKRPRVGSNSCPRCELIIDENRDSISCCVCELKFCIECSLISSALLAALKEDTTENFKWTCNGCKQNFPCMTNLTQQLKNIEDKTRNRMSAIEDKIESLDMGLGRESKRRL